MKPKVILVCLVIAIGALLVFWRKPVTPPASKAIPEAVTTGTPVAMETPRSASEPPAGADRPVSPPSPGNESASLLDAIGQALASTNAETREFAFTNLLPALVLADPLAAGHLAETNTIEGTRETVLQKVAQLLAARNPTNALAWATGLERDHERETVLTDVCLQLAQTDPAEAISIRAGFLTENQSYVALEDMTQKWAEKDLPAALAWIDGLPADERRNSLLERLAYIYAQTSPLEAANLVVEQMTPGQTQTDAAISVLHQWALRDFAAANAWVQQFPEGPLRERAVLELAGIKNSLHPANTP